MVRVRINLFKSPRGVTQFDTPRYRARETGYDIWVYGIVDYCKYLCYKKELLMCGKNRFRILSADHDQLGGAWPW